MSKIIVGVDSSFSSNDMLTEESEFNYKLSRSWSIMPPLILWVKFFCYFILGFESARSPIGVRFFEFI